LPREDQTRLSDHLYVQFALFQSGDRQADLIGEQGGGVDQHGNANQ
jgi:hypothetical protein